MFDVIATSVKILLEGPSLQQMPGGSTRILANNSISGPSMLHEGYARPEQGQNPGFVMFVKQDSVFQEPGRRDERAIS
ncbi:hypothetical protein ACRQ1B_07100 [Rhizobium panacihumi]|uniref:hypothetical protein n=1 Tax=Rhizobium panacihumi TaxID=2008450 RepID=UPI003D7BAA12